MAFVWKDPKDIFKGEGIYHLTFVVAGRRPLLGELVGLPTVERSDNTNAIPADLNAIEVAHDISVKERAKIAWVEFTPFGKAVDDMLRHYDEAHDGIKICQRMVLDDHVHVVLWVQKPQYSTVQHKPQSILQIAYGMRVQFTHMAQELGVWQKGVRVEGALHAEKGAGHVFEKQFVRTLSRRGQLREMIDYVELNAYRKYMKRQHPDLFIMHKDTEVEGLRFRSMGNHWLLDWPERQVVECSRSISEEDLQRQLRQTLQHAEQGAVTYTAAISKGEQQIARAVREAVLSAGGEVIKLYKDPLTKKAHPRGTDIDHCAQGQMLVLGPWDIPDANAFEQRFGDKDSKYAQFHNLNDLAKFLCEPLKEVVLKEICEE